MFREEAITLGDLVGKLKVLEFKCPKCGRWGQYLVDRLVKRYGSETRLFEWLNDRLVDCRRVQQPNSEDPCEADFLNLPKVL